MSSIPCYLTNRDCLEPVRGMVDHLQQCADVGEITIVDCGSTYPPLLAWYESCGVTVRRCENLGPRAAWVGRQHVSEFYFVSDSDLDLTGVPLDFLQKLREGLERYPDYIKAGLSLRIDDLPADLPLTARVLDVETPYWSKPLDPDWYDAPIDTTAALYRDAREWMGYGPALRAAPPYCAKHLAWYLRAGAVPPDWQYYFENLKPSEVTWSRALKHSLT